MNSTNFNARTVVTLVIIGVALIGGGFLMSQATPLLFPQQASAESLQVDELFRILLLIGGAIFLLVQGLLAYSVWRFRARPGDTSDGINVHGNTTLEIVWTAVPAVIVLVLTILSWSVWNTLQSPKEGEVGVAATGARFNWAFTYAAPMELVHDIDINMLPEGVRADIDADGMLTLTAPELHTYIGQPVRLEMEARDVLHSFWVPAFRVKQDLIPGRVTTVRFTPTAAGEYPIRCAELCGANHGIMVGNVIVYETEAEFNNWLMPMMMDTLFPPADPVERGQDILASNVHPCYTCHVLDDLEGWNGNVGPSLNGVADRAARSRAAATGLDPAGYLHQSIQEPNAYLVPGFGALMPLLALEDCEMQAIVAYLGTQTETGNEVTIDEEAYAQDCAGGAAPVSADATAEATADTPAEAAAPVVDATAAPTLDATAEATTET